MAVGAFFFSHTLRKSIRNHKETKEALTFEIEQILAGFLNRSNYIMIKVFNSSTNQKINLAIEFLEKIPVF
jgi:hypothetical protein